MVLEYELIENSIVLVLQVVLESTGMFSWVGVGVFLWCVAAGGFCRPMVVSGGQQHLLRKSVVSCSLLSCNSSKKKKLRCHAV